ncbi:MAG: phosphoribosyltransferase [Cyanobacteriota bacterium]
MVPLTPPWADRQTAGRALARQLLTLAPIPIPRLVLGLPRGGVIVAAPVALALQAPLHSWAVRKLALPEAPEVAIGAVAAGLACPVVIWESPERLPPMLRAADRAALLDQQWRELQRRQRLYGDPPPASLRDQALVVVDDGIATGLTVRAALASLRELGPRLLMLAVPVADRRVMDELRPLVDTLVVLHPVASLRAVGGPYRRFEAVEDQEVLRTLAAVGRRHQKVIP